MDKLLLFDTSETPSTTETFITTQMVTLAESNQNVSRAITRPCENTVVHDGHLFICLEKVNFLLMIASLFFILFITISVVGNLTVILAILKEKRLRTPSSYLILSLACTDLIVGGITVPIRALNEVVDYGTWNYGIIMCDLRVVFDKICVYASLLHVLIIAIDRYWTVSSLNYSLTRSGKHIGFMIFCVWTVSFFMAAAPMFGWRDSQFAERIKNGSCFVNTLFSLNFTVWLVIFVIPCTLTAILYIKVFLIIKNRLVSNKSSAQPAKSSSSKITMTNSVASQIELNGKSISSIKRQDSKTMSNVQAIKNIKPEMKSFEMVEKNQSLKDERKRNENKASRILMLITICIIICWSPFFTMYTISSIFRLKTASTYNVWFKFSIWLGYANSICNMMVYAFANPIYVKNIRNLLSSIFRIH